MATNADDLSDFSGRQQKVPGVATWDVSDFSEQSVTSAREPEQVGPLTNV